MPPKVGLVIQTDPSLQICGSEVLSQQGFFFKSSFFKNVPEHPCKLGFKVGIVAGESLECGWALWSSTVR